MWVDAAEARSLNEVESQEIMTEIHVGVCGWNLYWRATAKNILRAGYYWPNIFSDVFAKVRSCVECQKFVGEQKFLPLPLIPISAVGARLH